MVYACKQVARRIGAPKLWLLVVPAYAALFVLALPFTVARRIYPATKAAQSRPTQ
jgi:hypothetical protein